MTTNPEAGMRLVPVEPTPEMRRAWNDARPDNAVQEPDGSWTAGAVDWFNAQYAAMLAAAPVAPAGDDGVVGTGTMAEREARVMLDWTRGNLTQLGVANALCREGFKLEVAVEKSNALAARAQPPTGEAVERTAAREVMDLIASNDPVIRVLKDRGASEGLIDGVAYALIWDRKQRAAHPTEPVARDGGEAGWLVEDQNEPQWLTLKPAEAMWSMIFTKDSIEALRFPRRVDAEDYVRTHLDDAPVCITEHSWPVLSSPPASGQAG